MLLIVAAHSDYYTCSLNKDTDTWSGNTFLRVGPRLVLRTEVKKMDEHDFCIMLLSIFVHIPFFRVYIIHIQSIISSLSLEFPQVGVVEI